MRRKRIGASGKIGIVCPFDAGHADFADSAPLPLAGAFHAAIATTRNNDQYAASPPIA